MSDCAVAFDASEHAYPVPRRHIVARLGGSTDTAKPLTAPDRILNIHTVHKSEGVENKVKVRDATDRFLIIFASIISVSVACAIPHGRP